MHFNFKTVWSTQIKWKQSDYMGCSARQWSDLFQIYSIRDMVDLNV